METKTLYELSDQNNVFDLMQFIGIYMILLVAVLLTTVIPMWKLFKKANKPGWASIVPIYNTMVMIDIAQRPMWWIILLFIPMVNVVIAIMIIADFVKAFGKGTWFVLGLIFLPFIFLPILAFTDTKYLYLPSVNVNTSPTDMPANGSNDNQTTNTQQ